MISVTFVSNDGNGQSRTVKIREDITVAEFLDVNFGGDPNDYVFSVRPENGTSRRVDLSHVLEDGDRLVAAPSKVEGE